MSPIAKGYLFWVGIAASVGALLHIAIIFGGPDWYAFFGAPQALVEMARAGHPRAAISCLVIAGILSVLAGYAFSGAGTIRRLPLTRVILALAGSVLVLRGLLFVPLILWRADSLSRICDCRSVDAFIIVSSAICLFMGVGFALGAAVAPDGSIKSRPLRGSA
jgi:hypothetical protein